MLIKMQKFCLTFLCLFFITACGANNTVSLIYSEPTQASLGGSSVHIAVVELEDLRAKAEIGQRRNGDLMYAGSSVADWATNALAKQLNSAGCKVSLAASREEATALKADYILVGSVGSLWLKEISGSEYDVEMNVRVTLIKDSKGRLTENFSAKVVHKDLPFSNSESKAIADTMATIASSAAEKIIAVAQ